MIEQFLNEIHMVKELDVPVLDHGIGKENQEEVFISDTDKEHRLTNFVRSQYLEYVGKVLKENYEHWLETETEKFSGLAVSF